MNPMLQVRLEKHFGCAVARADATNGGDINEAFTALLADGRRWFVKTHAAAPPGMYTCEARGLQWLASAGALRVPNVELACDADHEGPACLVLERIEPSARQTNFEETLGIGLAALHRAGAPSFGLDYDNYLALLPQANAALSSWPRFYAERRLLPQVRMAERAGRIDARLVRRLHALCDKLEDLAGPDEPPARLHGDLWGGNLLSDERGNPCLIDPAVYGGHREVDLAMMRLFGGFGARVFEAYAQVHPLAPGYRERVPLYQVYPLLAHVNLFGGSYVNQVARAIARWV